MLSVIELIKRQLGLDKLEAIVADIATRVNVLYANHVDLNTRVNRLEKVIAQLLIAPPGPPSARTVREENGMLVQVAGLPSLTDVEQAQRASGELVSRRFYDPAGAATDLSLDATETGEFKVEEGVEVTIGLCNVDNAGNESTRVTQTYTAQDTIPPEAPGPFGEIKTVREE